jgi:hypothetical protein
MKKTLSKTHWLIDLGLLAGFLGAFYVNLTGIDLHQWLGLAVTILAFIHLVLHWDWVVAVFSRFFMKTSSRSRIYFLLDILIMLGAVVMFETGLVISTWFNFNLTNYADWLDIHVYSSVITLGLTVLKLGLHWRWIVNVAQKSFSRRGTVPVIHTLKPVPVPIPVNQKRVDRRQFLVLMGAVGGASVLAASNVLSKVKDVQSAAASQSTTITQEVGPAIPTAAPTTAEIYSATAPTAAPTALPQVASIATTQGCTVRCPRGCSYPGHCRRYTDDNNNNKCDLGECL